MGVRSMQNIELHRGARKCPACALINPATAERCDCGFVFPHAEAIAGGPHHENTPTDSERQLLLRVAIAKERRAAATDGEPDDEASLTDGERLLRQAITRVPPRTWLYLTLFAATHLVGLPVALSVIGAVLAAFFFLSIVWQVDCFEEEPWRLLERTFLWGALPAIMLAVIGEVLLHRPTRFLVGSAHARWFEVGFIGPIIEELCKGAVLVSLFRCHRDEFDSMMDGLLYGALVGLGFAMTENIHYYLHAKPGHLEGLILARGLVYGMNHACFSACFGLGLGIASDATTPAMRRCAPVVGLVAGMGLHMAHNLIVTAHAVPIRFAALGLAGGAAVIWFRLVAVARAREAQWIKEELGDEVKRKVMSAGEAAEVSDVQRRKTARAAALAESTYGAAHVRLRFYALATELAFAKHRARINGMHSSAARITKLRRSIARLRIQLQAAGWIADDSGDSSSSDTESAVNE